MPENTFKDYFSKQSDVYARSRPAYPPELFEFLASISPGNKTAWDCATGNGQAAVSLTKHFEKVIATDASEKQISNAASHPQVEYRIELAEKTGIEDNSIDLIAVASGIHWFSINEFYGEAKRVLKHGGVIAVWVYVTEQINPEVDNVLQKFYLEVLKDYWPQETMLVWDRYKHLEFPFDEITAPEFQTKSDQDFDLFIQWLVSLSPTQNYINQTGRNPVDLVYDELLEVWGETNEKKTILRDMALRVGKHWR